MEWKDEYSVGISEIDEQHKKIIGFIDLLEQAINEGRGNEAYTDIIDGLVQYAKVHFKTEEVYFEQYNYEFTSEHIDEHNKFIENVKDLQSPQEVLNFLHKWLINHIMSSDQKYAKAFSSKLQPNIPK